MVVTINGKSLYVYVSCVHWRQLRLASEFLRSDSKDGNLRVGSFCKDLFVELDRSPRELEITFLSVSRSEEQAMAFSLTGDDRAGLCDALASVADTLSK